MRRTYFLHPKVGKAAFLFGFLRKKFQVGLPQKRNL